MNRRLPIVTAVVLAALLASVGGAAAQDPGPEEGIGAEESVSAAAVVSSQISYQGMLEEDGEPVTGSRSMTFALHSNGSCTAQVADLGTSSVSVTDGLFTKYLSVSAGDFTGQALWLKVSVGGTQVDCLEILPAPYALSLRPGADVQGPITDGSVFFAYNDATSGDTAYGVYGKSASSTDTASGVYGYASATSGTTYGVYGESESNMGIGVVGLADAMGVFGVSESKGVVGAVLETSGETCGVQGQVASSSGRGVYGYATATSGTNFGVYGESDSSAGRGVYGYATATSATNYGVYGRSDSPSGRGVYGYGFSLTGTAPGVMGSSNSSQGGRGVYGRATSTTGPNYGVYGSSWSTTGGVGVYGTAALTGTMGIATATSGESYGVYGSAESWGSYGVYGDAENATNGTGVYGEGALYGVHGKSNGTLSDDVGVYGEGYDGVEGSGSRYGVNATGGTAVYADGTTKGVYAEGSSYGVEAYSDDTAVYGLGGDYGVHATVDGTSGTGVYALASATTGTTYGVYAKSESSAGAGVVAYNTSSGAGLAAAGWTGNIIEGWQGVPYGGISSNLRFKVTSAGNVYADNAYHCSLGTGSSSEPGTCIVQNSSADFAEMLPARLGLEAGDVLAVGPDGQVARSSEAYQPTVVGVYSAQAGYLGGGQHLGEAGYAPVALVGLVPVKASAENGAIQPGDLLVAADTPGRAMRAGDDPPVGTVVGKALEGLARGTGMVQMLVMLQ